MIQYLHKHRSEGGDQGSFESLTLNAAAWNLTSLHTLGASGDSKTAKQVKTKWDGVSTPNNSGLLLLILVLQLKAIFQAIITYRDTTSGTHWDNTVGANISGPQAEAAWNNYINTLSVSTIHYLTSSLSYYMIQSTKLMTPFSSKGWEHFEKMQEIMLNEVVMPSQQQLVLVLLLIWRLWVMRVWKEAVVEHMLATPKAQGRILWMLTRRLTALPSSHNLSPSVSLPCLHLKMIQFLPHLDLVLDKPALRRWRFWRSSCFTNSINKFQPVPPQTIFTGKIKHIVA